MFFILFYLNLHIYDYMLFAVPVVICVDVELGKLGVSIQCGMQTDGSTDGRQVW